MDFTDRVFDGEDVSIDGNSYTNCQFNDCNIFFEGGLFEMADCTFAQNTRWVLRESAIRTVRFISLIYAQPELREGAKAIWNDIKSGKYIS